MKKDSDIFSIINPVSIKYPGITRVGIFGSYARNDPDYNDIDIVFDESPDNDVLDSLNFSADLRKNIWKKMHKKSDILDYQAIIAPTADEDDEEIKNNILQDLVWIYEK